MQNSVRVVGCALGAHKLRHVCRSIATRNPAALEQHDPNIAQEPLLQATLYVALMFTAIAIRSPFIRVVESRSCE